ncbi:hypothetical protein [Comamonas testosteroni]|uniref:hypothetical protein n=1 Tax=Comamonas testosteroni TaxID=285 RepID=UPI00391CDABC
MPKITGEAVVIVGKYTGFNPAKPEATPAHAFQFAGPNSLDESGALSSVWANDGWVVVGKARIEIDLIERDTMTANAVATLRKQKEAVIAAAQMEATRIEGQIQSLLAITNEA